MTARRALLGAGVIALACCSGACSEDAPRSSGLPPAFATPLPLPGCEGFDYGGCDVRSPACLEKLAQIAACARGGGGGSDPARAASLGLALSSVSEDEARRILLDSLSTQAPPEPDYFALVLTQLGLTEPNAFQPEVSAERLAQRWAAFYRRDVGEVIVIEHAADPDPIASDALVLHELIHALQDREHGLDAFARAYQTDSDGNLRGQSVIEGEAQFHEQRFYAASTGVDVSRVDWVLELASQREAAEQQLFAETDLYSASLLRVPYAHGCEYAARIWAEGGPSALSGLLAAPPRDMRQILGRLWGDGEPPPESAPPAPAPLGAADAALQAWSTLGAWGVYLFFRPRFSDARTARELALAWRGDRLEAYSFGERQSAGRWSIELADEGASARALAAVGDQARLRALRVGARIVVQTASTDEMPSWLTP